MTGEDGTTAFDDAFAAAEQIQNKPDVTPGVGQIGTGAPKRPEPEAEILDDPRDRRTAKVFGNAVIETASEHTGANFTDTAATAAADFAEVMLELGRMTGRGVWFRGALSLAALGLVIVPPVIMGLTKLKGEEDD